MAAVNNAGSTPSAYWTFTNGTATPTPPAAPALTSPTNGATVNGTSLTFQWAASSGATGYQLTVLKVSDNSVLIDQSLGNVLASVQTGFPNNGTQYKWAVAAVNSAGSTPSAYCTFTNGTTGPTPPPAPVLTSPVNDVTVSGTAINFRWAASSGATGYWLTVMKVNDDSIVINKSVGNALSYTQSGFPNDGTQYKWGVAAGNSTGWTGSAYCAFTNGTAGPTPPTAPTLTSPLDEATVNGTSLTFQWAASSGATGYWLSVIRLCDNSVLVNRSLGNVLSATQSGFPNDGTEYKWAVAAGNSLGWTTSVWQTFLSGTVTTPPAAPAVISPAGGITVNGPSLDFRWTASSGSTGFRVTIIKVSDNSVMVDKYVGNVLRFTQYGFAEDGSQYRWAVAAGNSAGWTSSAWQTFISGSSSD